MFYIVDRFTPEEAPDVLDVEPPAPFGMYLGKPLDSPPLCVRARLTSLSHVLDMWWIGPYFVVSASVLQLVVAVGETHFQLIPLVLLDRKKKACNDKCSILHLLDNVPCLNLSKSVVTRDRDGIIKDIHHLVLNEGAVPEDRHLFRLAEKADLILARDDLVQQLLALAVRGVRFLPCEGTRE